MYLQPNQPTKQQPRRGQFTFFRRCRSLHFVDNRETRRRVFYFSPEEKKKQNKILHEI